jgi:acyl-CoA reductase-like NAD-dependent aldehyde dehydrogenase
MNPQPAFTDFSLERKELPAARKGSFIWSKSLLKNRLQLTKRFRHSLAEAASDLAKLAASDSHPVQEVLVSEVLPLLEACLFLERNATQLLQKNVLGSKHRPLWLSGVHTELRREPMGVVAVISPSNYPIFLGGTQVLQALVAGNAVLWKPAPGCAPAARGIAELLKFAGLPDDVLQILPDTTDAGKALASSPVDKVIFTGGGENGRGVLRALAERAIPAVVELSGCDAVFVRADADLQRTARALRFGVTLNAGKTCMAPRRVYVAQEVAGDLEIFLLKELIASHPSPLLSDLPEAQVARLREMLSDAKIKGARFLHGGLNADGSISLPVIFTEANPSMRLFCEDIFFPVLGFMAVESDEAALRAASLCGFALGASIFSRDHQEAKRLAERIDAGLVSINDLIAPSADPRVPFGGRGESGYGVTRGAAGLLELTRIKVIQTREGRVTPHLDSETPQPKLIAAAIRLLHSGTWKKRLSALVDLVGFGWNKPPCKIST